MARLGSGRAITTALTTITFVAFTLALSPIASHIVVAFTSLSIGIELFLQITERLIIQPLLFAQGIGQTFHSLFSCGFTALTLTLRNPHVLYHLLQFF